MKAAAVLLLLSALVPVARAVCDTTAISTCLDTYLSAVQSMALSGSTAGLCGAIQTYYTCVLKACPGVEFPQSILDSLNQHMQQYGLNCVLNGAGRLGQSSLLLVAAALFLSIFLRG